MILSLLYLQRTLSYWPSGLKGPLLCSTIVGGGPQARPYSHPLHYPKELPENHTAIVPCFLPMGKWKSDCCAFRSIPTTVGKGFSWAQRGSILSVLQWNLASSQWWLVIGTKSYPENPACGKAFFQQAEICSPLGFTCISPVISSSHREQVSPRLPWEPLKGLHTDGVFAVGFWLQCCFPYSCRRTFPGRPRSQGPAFPNRKHHAQIELTCILSQRLENLRHLFFLKETNLFSATV